MLNSLHHPDRVLAGTSAAAQRLRLQVERVAPYYRTAMLVGEAGCLKEQVARALQARSPLRDDCFRVHHGRSFPDDALEIDSPTTLYIAGIGQLGLVQQEAILQKLRSAFRTGRPELRFICSSDVSPRGLVAAGRLNAEFLSCISAVEVRVSPLRERLEDLPALLEGIPLHRCALEALSQHHWPGNLRELHEKISACMERAGSAPIGPEHLPDFTASRMDDEGDLKLEAVLRRHVTAVLEGCAGNKLRAAEMLGISRSTLYRMLEAHGG